MHPKGRVFGWDEKWRENDRNDCLVDEGNWESISLSFFLSFFFFFFFFKTFANNQCQL